MLLALLVALLGVSPLTVAAQDAPALVVNDAGTAANADDLVQTSLFVPADFGLPPHGLNAPGGFSVSVVGAGLKAPRFMAFDDGGNLLVAAAGNGAIFRYPGADGAIDPTPVPPAPLLSGLEAPSNVALWGGYLYVGETSAISRYAYDPFAGTIGGREVVVPDLPHGGHSTRTVAFGRSSSSLLMR